MLHWLSPRCSIVMLQYLPAFIVESATDGRLSVRLGWEIGGNFVVSLAIFGVFKMLTQLMGKSVVGLHFVQKI